MRKKIPLLVVILVAAAMVTAGMTALMMSFVEKDISDSYMSRFSNNAELSNFLDKSDYARQLYGDGIYFGGLSPTSSGEENDMRAPDFSKTNVQVEGVDEADIVKTDGELIFAANWDSVAILKAYPPEDLAVLSYINSTDLVDNSDEVNKSASIAGMYVKDDVLVVISMIYVMRYYYWDMGYDSSYKWDPNDDRTQITLFDIRDPANPDEIAEFSMSGYYVSSRMIGDYVYLISQFYIYKDGNNYILPTVERGSLLSEEIDVDDILYDPDTDDASSFLSILAVDISSVSSEHISIVSGWSSTIYMSLDALYLTYQKSIYDGIVFSSDVARTTFSENNYTTTIYKISVDKLSMTVSARGEVGGWMLNQFSMDENDGFLRVATTSEWANPDNSVYVLDEDLEVVGSLEGLAPTERIYSVRFVQDTLYLVTFRQVDPLFVIDLSNPYDPKVLGEVEITGFSTYLHPIDDDHVLGIGFENWSVKISIFDVSDPTDPTEMDRYVISGGSWSEANYDHKAVLFDKQRELLVIPASSYTDYEHKTGAFVFKISLTEGISLRGVIDHGEYNYLRRALYIDDNLYTISGSVVMVNSLSDLSEINSVQYREEPHYYYLY